MTPQPIRLSFVLAASAAYAGTIWTPSAVAALTISCPSPRDTATPADGQTELEKLVGALASWLARTYSTGSWDGVVKALGEGLDPPPAGWEGALDDFLASEVAFTIDPTDLTEIESAAPVPVAWFPMFAGLELSGMGAAPIVFADASPTDPNYAGVVAAYFADLARCGLTADPPDPPAVLDGGGGGSPARTSLASLVFDGCFLALARQLARELAGAGSSPQPPGQPTRAIVADLGRLLSRHLLGGLRLPDPRQMPPVGPADPRTLTIASGYALTGQQFPVDATKPTCSAVPGLGPAPGVAAKIEFAGGATSVTSTMPVAPLPPAPAPTWIGPQPSVAAGALAGPTITVESTPAARARDRSVAARTRLPWQQSAGATRFVVPLPPDVLRAARDEALTLTVTPDGPAGDVTGAVPALAVEAMLLIPITVHRVDRARDANVSPLTPAVAAGAVAPAGDDTSADAPFVYRVDGTDEATRDRIDAALADAALGSHATISLLYDAPTTGYASDRLDPAAHPVLLAKINLATTRRPGTSAPAPPPAAPADDDVLGPMSATPADVADFLRILWEVSVVRAAGFLLRYETADGMALPEAISSATDAPPGDGVPGGDSASLTVAVTFAAPSIQRWHNAFSVTLDPSYEGPLHLAMANAAGPIQDLCPASPPGCVAFSATWALQRPPRTRALALYEPGWVARLYRLIGLQINGQQAGSTPAFGVSPWSLPLRLAQDDDTDQDARTYRRVVPVYRFATNGDEPPNPYAAVGGKPILSMRLGDVYGNTLASAGHDGVYDVLYNDPLWTPADWPGTRVAYRFVPASPPRLPSPSLRLSLKFEPGEVIGAGTPDAPAAPDVPDAPAAVEQRARVALRRVASVIDQLRDPRTLVTVTASVAPSLDYGAPLKQQLLAHAQAIAAQLQVAIDGGTPTPVSLVVPIAIAPADLAKAKADVLEVAVTLCFSRPAELVYVDAAERRVDRSAACSLAIAADLEAPGEAAPEAIAGAGTSGGDAPVPIALEAFAGDFEAAFVGFVGPGSGVQLAVRSDTPADPAGAPPTLWAIRRGAAAGIALDFPAAAAAYFSLAPLASSLSGGDALVPTYDARLVPTYTRQTFAGVDLDAWARMFLEAADRIVSPDLATVIAAADREVYTDLMRARSLLAQALAAGVQPVHQPHAAAGAGAGAGSLAGARDHFEQAVLARLSSAYSIASVVQAPVNVHATDEPSDPSRAVRLFGGVGLTESSAGGGAAPPGVAISSAKLALVSSTAENPAYLTFSVAVTDAVPAAKLELDLRWSARFAERLTGDVGPYGYQPSECLRVVRDLGPTQPPCAAAADDPPPPPSPPSWFALGTFAVPIPARRYPSPPILRDQMASQAAAGQPTGAGDPLGPYLRWDYAVGLTLPGQLPQDALWVDVTYNLPVAPAPTFLVGDGDPPPPTLFQALAAFIVAWPALKPHLLGLTDRGRTPDDGVPVTEVVAAVREQLQPVARAWARLRGIPDPWALRAIADAGAEDDAAAGDAGADAGAEVDAAAAAAEAGAEAAAPGATERTVDSYMVDFQDAYAGNQLGVYARARQHPPGGCEPEELKWPTINGKPPNAGTIAAVCAPPESRCAEAPTADACWYRATYAFEPPRAPGQAGPLELVWAGIDVLRFQTAGTACRVTRNARLSGAGVDIQTNRDFIYRPPPVAFPGAVVPSIVVPPVGPLPPQVTLAATLQGALGAIARAGSAAATTERRVRVALSYAFRLGGPDGVRTTTPILLVDRIALAPDTLATGRGGSAVTLAELCLALDADCQAWFEHLAPVTTDATVSVALVLFAVVAGGRLQVVELEDVELTVPAAWWPPAGPA